MDIMKDVVKAEGVRFSLVREGREVARAYVYLMTNNLHDHPFALLEDVFVDESARGKGLGTAVVRAAIAEAQARGCYKMIATSRHARPKVHELYSRLGFADHGKEFRLNF